MTSKAGMRAMLAAVAAVSAAAAYASARLTYADWLFRRNTTGSVKRAAEIERTNGRYRAWLAELLDNEGAEAETELAAASRSSPMDARVRIRRGLSAEAAGHADEAERLYLDAAAISRLFEPRWTLANFYFRRGDAGRFWHWSREAFEIGYGDRKPLFDLCWRVRPDAGFIESNALPKDYAVELQFMNFLVSKGCLEDAANLASRIVGNAPAADTAAFEQCVEQLIPAGRQPAALKLWNSLCLRRLLPGGKLDPPAGASLTNGRFDWEPRGLAFDWRAGAAQGIAAIWMSDPHRMRFTFNGSQPDEAVLLSQVAPVDPSRRYELRFEYRTWQIAPAAGIRMSAFGEATPDLASDEWTAQKLRFDARGRDMGQIALCYHRPLGKVRVEGTLDIRNVSLDFAP